MKNQNTTPEPTAPEKPDANSRSHLSTGSQPTVQDTANRFNAEYVKACKTGRPDDWHQAALAGRQLVHDMGKAGMIEDNFYKVHDEIFFENERDVS